MGLLRNHPVASFVALAMVFTYGIGLPWYFLTESYERAWGVREELLSLFFMRAGPTIAGLAVVAAVAGRRGIAMWFRQLLRWRVNPLYYVALLVIVVGAFASTNFVIFDAQSILNSPDVATDRPWLALLGSYLAEIAYITVTNGEETGWRFALLGLLLVRFRLLAACLIVGVVWAIWHAPAFFLFGQSGLWYPLIVICLAYALIYGWLYRATGSLFLVILAHGAANATYYTFERHFTELSARWDSIEPTGDWAFAFVSLAVAVVVVGFRWRMFFHASEVAQSKEDWAWVGAKPLSAS